MTNDKVMFCFGLGYTARALAASLPFEDWVISGTSRGDGSRDRPKSDGTRTYVFDRDRPLPWPTRTLAGVTHVLVSVPPDSEGDPVLDCHGTDIGSMQSLSWIGYLSTVGVYGDRRGGWVDETSECRPRTERSIRRAAAERAWLDLSRRKNVPVHVFVWRASTDPGEIRSNRLGGERQGESSSPVRFSRAYTFRISFRSCALQWNGLTRALSITFVTTNRRPLRMSSPSRVTSRDARCRPWSRSMKRNSRKLGGLSMQSAGGSGTIASRKILA